MLHVSFYCSVHDTSFKQIEAKSFECVIHFSVIAFNANGAHLAESAHQNHPPRSAQCS